MSDLNPTSPAESPELSALQAECADLQSQTHTLRIVLLFVIGALCLFFWREAGFNGYLARQMQPQVIQAAQYVEALHKQGTSLEKQLQVLQNGVSRLVDYGKAHPDYVPLLTKYGIPVNTTSAPAPAPATPKK